MIDLTTATKEELLLLFEGLMELNYGKFTDAEVEEIKRIKGEFRKELNSRCRRTKPMYKDPTNTHIIFMSQEPVELTPELLETYGGKCVKTGNGTTIDPCEECCKLPEEEKAEFIAGIIKIIEKNEAEKQNKGYEYKFKELREKHNLILPCIKTGTVSFTFKEGDPKRHTYHYWKSSTHWEYLGVNEIPEAKAVMDDIIQAGIITKDGKINFEHHI